MLSRVANSIYWLARYVERAENVARFIDVNLNLILDLPRSDQEQWEPLVRTTGDYKLFLKQYGEANRENVIRFLTFDAANANSILSCLRAARENARTVREIISSEMWEHINTSYQMVQSSSASSFAMEVTHRFYQHIKMASHLFNGLTDATMSHGEGWHFARIGRLTERADKTSRILDVKYFILLPSASDVGTPFDNIQWAAVLKSTSGLEMYRKQMGPIQPKRVAAFLLLDRDFPRAVRYSLLKAEESLHAITGSPMGTFRNSAEQGLGRLRSELDYTQVEDIIGGGLHEFLDNFQLKLNHVSDGIHETFFALRPTANIVSQGQVQ